MTPFLTPITISPSNGVKTIFRINDYMQLDVNNYVGIPKEFLLYIQKASE